MLRNSTIDKQLINAASEGSLEVVRELLAKGASVNSPTTDNDTALIWASRNGSIEIIRLLLASGAHVNEQKRNGWTALMSATCCGHTKIVFELLANGADVNLRTDSGYTALTLAVSYGRTDIVDLIEGHITEQLTYPRRKNELELFFLGKQLSKEKNATSSRSSLGSFFSSITSFFSPSKPQSTIILPNALVEIIEDYARPPNTQAPSRKP